MTACELFEQLGYTKKTEEDDIIIYEKYIDDQVADRITFYVSAKEVILGGMQRGYWMLDHKLLAAINKQAEELWWNYN